jgi:hypothetical protein
MRGGSDAASAFSGSGSNTFGEVNPKFADTGEAYLMGIGVTDSPASLGTDVLSPCEGIEYLPEGPRTQYVTDRRYADIYAAASPILQCMLEISTQTGAREGMIFDIRVGDFDEHQLELRVTKKRNDLGHTRRRTR